MLETVVVVVVVVVLTETGASVAGLQAWPAGRLQLSTSTSNFAAVTSPWNLQ